jgi:hypothetical protein
VIHSWRPDIARAAQGIETCARPGCTAERRPSDGKRSEHFVYRASAGAQWVTQTLMPRCTGASLAKARRSRAVDKGDEL